MTLCKNNVINFHETCINFCFNPNCMHACLIIGYSSDEVSGVAEIILFSWKWSSDYQPYYACHSIYKYTSIMSYLLLKQTSQKSYSLPVKPVATIAS